MKGVSMFIIGNEELEKASTLKDSFICDRCGEIHSVYYGKKEMPDGMLVESKTLAFYRCGDKTYLAGIKEKDIRNLAGGGE